MSQLSTYLFYTKTACIKFSSGSVKLPMVTINLYPHLTCVLISAAKEDILLF